MAALHINLLGGFEAHRGSGELLALKGRKTQALFAYLALGAGASRPRDELVALFWGDRGEQQARSSLRQSLSELRKALGDADNSPLIAVRDAVSLDSKAVDVDVCEFERLIDEGTPAALEQAAALYRGDLLDGIAVHDPAFEDWLRGERRRLHERACNALSGLLDHQAVANTEAAVVTARRAVELDPLNSYGHLHLAYGQIYSRQFDTGWSHMERAEALNPNDADTLALKGMFQAFLGRPDEAIGSIERAWRLNPLETEWYMWNLAITLHTARRYEEAVAAYRRLLNPANEVLACLAACHAQLGDEAAARALMGDFRTRAKDELAIYPGDDPEGWRRYWSNSFPYKDPADLKHLLDGLRKAGLPV